jgi:hypothetical protein
MKRSTERSFAIRRNALALRWLRGISNVDVSYEVSMLAKLNSDERLFRVRTVTARDIFLTPNCCDARRNWCDERRDITKGKVAFVKQGPLSPCGDCVDVTISSRVQHRGVTQHGSEGKRQDGGHVE